jgi:nitroreductase
MVEKTVSKAIEYRRSVRRYDATKPLNKEDIKSCIQQASLAPTSSNLQLWEFYHITNTETLQKIAKACFDQSAAKTALQLVVTIVRKDLWKQRAAANISFLTKQFENQKVKNLKDEKKSMNYYKKVITIIYIDFFGLLGWLKKIIAFIIGMFRPMYREVSSGDVRVIAHKSAALASQNFMISMAALGYDTCPMEGFDSKRVKRILGLPKKAEINMIIGCGYRAEGGIYGQRFRVPFEEVYREV